MTNSTFSTHYLRRGELFDGMLTEPQLSLVAQLKMFPKRLVALFKTE